MGVGAWSGILATRAASLAPMSRTSLACSATAGLRRLVSIAVLMLCYTVLKAEALAGAYVSGRSTTWQTRCSHPQKVQHEPSMR